MYAYKMNLKDKYQKLWFENVGNTLNFLSPWNICKILLYTRPLKNLFSIIEVMKYC